jgi:outer membrane protein OmpA-like peptidoglycan-associated protein
MANANLPSNSNKQRASKEEMAGSKRDRREPLEDRLAGVEEIAKSVSAQIAEEQTNKAQISALKSALKPGGAVEIAKNDATYDRISALPDFEVKGTETINFEVGSAALTFEAKTTLDGLAGRVKNEPSLFIEVRGFASSDGTEKLNRDLSLRRANAVVRYLAQAGVPLERLVQPFGFGETMPVADNWSREGRILNRRAEVCLLVSPGNQPAASGVGSAILAAPRMFSNRIRKPNLAVGSGRGMVEWKRQGKTAKRAKPNRRF